MRKEEEEEEEEDVRNVNAERRAARIYCACAVCGFYTQQQLKTFGISTEYDKSQNL
jgi:hypothetical protein